MFVLLILSACGSGAAPSGEPASEEEPAGRPADPPSERHTLELRIGVDGSLAVFADDQPVPCGGTPRCADLTAALAALGAVVERPGWSEHAALIVAPASGVETARVSAVFDAVRGRFPRVALRLPQ